MTLTDAYYSREDVTQWMSIARSRPARARSVGNADKLNPYSHEYSASKPVSDHEHHLINGAISCDDRLGHDRCRSLTKRDA
jgi:hypothetical protein